VNLSSGHPRIAGLMDALARRLSDRAHAAADGRAQARGWEVTQTPGRFGLRGRSYRDPRFAARQQYHQNAGRKEDRYG
jgi:hypothetical protein